MTIYIVAKNDTDRAEYASVIRKAAHAVMRSEKQRRFGRSVTVLLTDESGIQELNAAYREVDAVTDVLSFPSGEERFLGDIAICVPRALAQAAEIGQSDKREVAFLTIHSMLHLLGYDHMEQEDEAVMTERQRAVVRSLYGEEA